MFIPRAFEGNMDKRDAPGLCQKWKKKGIPPPYLACASYAAHTGNREIIQEQLCRQLQYVFEVMNDDTEGNVPVREFFEGMASKLQIIKYQERVERENLIAYQKELNDPKPGPKKPKGGANEKGKGHHLYLLFATEEIWDTLRNFPEEVIKFFTPEPFSQKQLACAMRDTLEGKLTSYKIHCINSTAKAVDPLIPIARDAAFYEIMNNYGHR